MIPSDEEHSAYQRNVELWELQEQILRLIRGHELNPTELMSLLIDVFSELQPRVPSVVDLARRHPGISGDVTSQNDELDSRADAASRRFHATGEGRRASEVIAQLRQMLEARRAELDPVKRAPGGQQP